MFFVFSPVLEIYSKTGTGKTECVKSLGSMLGRLVLVFNCSEVCVIVFESSFKFLIEFSICQNVDVTAMSLILTGLARCGAWGCFDEFNRLQEGTLSSLSMIIQPIQAGIKAKQESVMISEKSVPLDLHCGIFVTLNPAGEEYGGRQALPANLQALFRPIVMQQPEPIEIARVILFVEGFTKAESIGRRLVDLFSMTQKILTAQKHYDWGLRELKTVLHSCGDFLKNDVTHDDELKREINAVVKALRSNTMSKLCAIDCGRFNMLIDYIFAEGDVTEGENDELKQFIEQTIVELGLTLNAMQVQKCISLYEQLQKRMGVVVLGAPMTGKSTIILILVHTLQKMNKTIKTHFLAPKALPRELLLGRMDADTNQWHDGVLTATAFQVSEEPSEVSSWIICDGDVDPDWIEALNSVLDDNK